MLTVVVGATFHNQIAAPPPQTVIVHHPAQVVFDRSASEGLLRSVKRKVPFELEVPTVLESSSRPAYQEPVRAYLIADGHKAVRLTYNTGGDLYWGVQETNWDGAPVLADKSFDHVLGGRHFTFYYHGARLHMVVLHANGATYWVVNSLLDDLSNETMIAIAKGLRPLDQPAKPKKKVKRRAKAKGR
jgi:hypothetical protein